MTVQGGSRPACAACRFQRRRCTPDCPLAPYFPANQPMVFQNAHRLYGVGNILKILNKLDTDEQKQDAMKSIKYESNIRQMYKVHGCYGVIIHLREKLEESVHELKQVLQLLDSYRKCNNLIEDSAILPSGSYNNQIVDGSSNLMNDPGVYVDGLNDNRNPVEAFTQVMATQPFYWNEEQLKTNSDLMRMQSQFDEFGLCEAKLGCEESSSLIEVSECGLFDDGEPPSLMESERLQEFG